MHRSKRSKSPAVDQDDDDSAEYLDPGQDDEKLHSSTPNLTEDSVKTVKKKKHFKVFHRHSNKRKQKNELDQKLSESLPAGKSNGHGLLSDANHRWSEESRSGQRNLEKLSSSVYSSSTSLLSVESEMKEMSDEEMVESLVNPQGIDSFSAASISSPLSHSVSLPERGEVQYTVKITLLSGHGLAIRDRTGSSDPYVKFKCPPFKYRSAVVHRNLNPEWKEHFSFQTRDLSKLLVVHVYDHDYGSLDDYMGGQTIDLTSYVIGEQHIVDLGLVDPAASKNESLGFIRLFLKISPTLAKEAAGNTGEDSVAVPSRDDKKHSKASSASKVWKSVLTVTLLEGSNFPPMDQNGLSDPYCKFKLGSQKFKSKAQSKTLNPKWMQRFNLRVYDDCSVLHIEVWDKDFPQNDDFIGMCSIDLLELTRDVTHNFTLPLMDKHNHVESEDCTIRFALCITATKVEEDEEQVEAAVCRKVAKNYSLARSLNISAIKQRDIGHLWITIDKVVDLVPANCFVLVELGNSCVRTHSVLKTANPSWNKTFEFTVGDIHETLEIMVYKSGSRSDQLLGKVNIPLHRLRNGAQQYTLKDKNCQARSRGVLHMETEFVYNPVRAMIRTINPKEDKLLESEQKFKKKVLMDKIKRVSNLSRTVLSTLEFIESTWSWENKPLTIFSFLVFMLVTLFGELWMVFFGCASLLLYHYLVVYIKNDHVWQNRVSTNVHIVSNIRRPASIDHDDSDFSDNIEDKHSSSLREKFRQFQGILVLVQTVLGYIADTEEEIRNLLNWRVPFLSWMAILVLLGASILFFVVPTRYIILLWGINKYTKRLRKPNYISNNELLDFLSRCPTNKQLQEWNELPLAVSNKFSSTDSKSQKKSTRKTK